MSKKTRHSRYGSKREMAWNGATFEPAPIMPAYTVATETILPFVKICDLIWIKRNARIRDIIPLSFSYYVTTEFF